MKTQHWILVAMLCGGATMADDAKPRGERPQRGDRPIPAAILKEFDADGDGKLSETERATMIETMRERHETRRKAMLARFDADGDGKLSEDERSTMRETITKEMLLKYDADGDGELSRDERRAMIEGEGFNPLAAFMRTRGERGEGAGPRRPRGEDGAERRKRGERRQRPAPTE